MTRREAFPDWFKEPFKQQGSAGDGPRPIGQGNRNPEQNEEKTNEWRDLPEPQPLGGLLPAVKAFDPLLLPEGFRAFVEDAAERMQVPADAIAIPLVVGASSAVGRRARITPKKIDSSWIVIPNLWGGVVMPPGFLKTPTLRLAIQPLCAIERRWHRDHQVRLSEYKKEAEKFVVKQIAWKEKAKAAYKKGEPMPEQPDEAPSIPTAPRLIVNDPTPEALHQILADNPAGVLYLRDELVGWLVDMDRQGREQSRAFMLECWNGDGEFTIDRIGRGSIRADALCLSVIGGLTPARLRFYLADVLADKATNDGLMQRLQLLAWPDPPKTWKSIDRFPNATAAEKVIRVFENLARLDADAHCRLQFCPAAQAAFDEWLGSLEIRIRAPEEHPAMVSHLSKYRSLMPSLAGLFSLIELAGKKDASLITFFDVQPQPISLYHTHQAIAWTNDYLESHARRAYSCIISPAVRAAHDLALKLKAGKLGQETFRVREVYLKSWSGLDTPERARQALTILEDADWIWPVPGTNSVGRPPEQFQINSRVFVDAPDPEHQNHQNSAGAV